LVMISLSFIVGCGDLLKGKKQADSITNVTVPVSGSDSRQNNDFKESLNNIVNKFSESQERISEELKEVKRDMFSSESIGRLFDSIETEVVEIGRNIRDNIRERGSDGELNRLRDRLRTIDDDIMDSVLNAKREGIEALDEARLKRIARNIRASLEAIRDHSAAFRGSRTGNQSQRIDSVDLYKEALAFALDEDTGLGYDHGDATAFADRINAITANGKLILDKYISIYKKAISSELTKDAAKALAEEMSGLLD